MEIELDKQKLAGAVVDTNPPMEMAPSPALMKLDLGAGQNPREGFQGVDLYGDKAAHKVDLFKFPWPFPDNSVDELHSSHFIEHIPAREIDWPDITPGSKAPEMEKFVGQDMFFAFFDECWRILKHKSVMTVICPSLRSNRAFQDPTHRRFIPAETFAYLDPEWRKLNKLDHYRIRCHFNGQCNHSVVQDLTLLHPEAAQRRLNECWNVVGDWVVNLVAIKEPTNG